MEDLHKKHQTHARRACNFCTKRKIRCTKEIPTCSSCNKYMRKCIYDECVDPTNRDANLPPWDDVPNHNAAVRFIDDSIFQRGPSSTPSTFEAVDPVPDYAKAILDEPSEWVAVATSYYQLASPWLPMISRRKVFDQLLNPLLPRRIDTAFLILCMKLVTYSQATPELWKTEYYTAVRFRMDAQLAGIISLEMLQGCILLAAYEQSQAIYPAAHISIGICFQLATALGMNSLNASLGSGKTSLQDMEERRRTWWAIFVLERLAALGSPRQTLLVPDPELTALLPCLESDWVNDAYSEVLATLSSPPQAMGRFSSIIQASYLLSCVLKHTARTFIDADFERKEVEQLNNTLQAMIRYSDNLTGGVGRIICYQRAIVYNAIMTLYKPFLQRGPADALYSEAVDAFDNAARVALQTVDDDIVSYNANFQYGDVPPFVLAWIYNAGVWFTHIGANEELRAIEAALYSFTDKWRAAVIYLELLAARKIIGGL